jgi:hypothetical protein
MKILGREWAVLPAILTTSCFGCKHNVVPMYDKYFVDQQNHHSQYSPTLLLPRCQWNGGTNHHFVTKQDEMEYSSRFMLYSAFQHCSGTQFRHVPLFACPFAFPFAFFASWNFFTSSSAHLSNFLFRSDRYPNIKRNSSQTNNGARKMAWYKLSNNAGARPSKTPCPMNCVIQETMLMPMA